MTLASDALFFQTFIQEICNNHRIKYTIRDPQVRKWFSAGTTVFWLLNSVTTLLKSPPDDLCFIRV